MHYFTLVRCKWSLKEYEEALNNFNSFLEYAEKYPELKEIAEKKISSIKEISRFNSGSRNII